MLSGENYPVASEACGLVSRLCVTDRLERERVGLTERLEKIDAILAGLKANPETQKLLDSISELGGF